MKKITYLMMVMLLCCIGSTSYAQEIETEHDGYIITAGVALSDIEPNKWYFIHQSRGNSGALVLPGEYPIGGAFVQDMGAGTVMKMTTDAVANTLISGSGVSAREHKDKLVRFVPVADKEGVYRIQFATGNWMGTEPKTVTNVQHIAGNSGEYNFYLIKIDGEPNNAGRFGWNKYNMANLVDNNGAGGTVSFWSSGERDAENANDGDENTKTMATTSEEITGNNVWQIHAVEQLEKENLHQVAFNALTDTYFMIYDLSDGNFIYDLEAGSNVGDNYGNYRTEDAENLVSLFWEVDDFYGKYSADLPQLELDYTVEQINAMNQELKDAYNRVLDNKIPLAVSGIAPGYYTINNMLNWHETANVYYTQEECDEYNSTNGLDVGDEGYLTTADVKETTQVAAPVKSLYADNQTLKWGTQQPKNTFLWKIEGVEGRPYAYRLINMDKSLTFNDVPTSGNVQLVTDDTTTVVFDYMGTGTAPVIGGDVTYYGIRPAKNSEGEYHYAHCGGHDNGAASSGNIVGWNASGIPASNWYLTPVDDATVEEWMTTDEVKLRRLFEVSDSILNTVPAQIEVAKDVTVVLNEDEPVVTDNSQFSSPYTEPSEGSLDNLLDGDFSTFWHSIWSSSKDGRHYLQIDATYELYGTYAVKFGRRQNQGNQITKLYVRGYYEDNEELTFEDGNDLGMLELPWDGEIKYIIPQTILEVDGEQYFRFYAEGNAFWHVGELNMYPAEVGTAVETTQYEARQEIVDRLIAAMETWNAKEYSSDNAALYTDEAFKADYNELLEAAEAWGAVYVDPAALRAAIAAAPDSRLFVVGNNPGQWKADVVTPADAVNEAKAYDNAGAYDAAQSEALIQNIETVTANAFASANQVETGKWYRFRFMEEYDYEDFGWDISGAKDVFNEAANVEVSPALFGKVVAAGKGVTVYETYDNEEEGTVDTLETYRAEAVTKIYDNQGLYFFDEDDIATYTNGEDLFRFIQATDSSYIIQNKASGLFLTGGHPATLSAIPSYFQSRAIGAGANAIGYTTVLGDFGNYLHGERSTNRLVTWSTDNVGSNSALLIEEVEAVTDEPATAYETKLWPGNTYAKTSPVDISVIGTEATAYGAELVVGEEGTDTAIVLKAIEAEVIKAGTPYILVADCDYYITPAKRLEELKADGTGSLIDNQYAAELRDAEYVAVAMDHGMVVDTLQKGNGDLIGTFRDITIEAGKGIVTKDNGFTHTPANTTLGAYGAYVKSDFDPTTYDVVGTLVVDYEGTVDTGINEVLNTVAKSGNIYTVDGKLVGKGNINAINKLPAGIYIVNGVKVTKN